MCSLAQLMQQSLQLVWNSRSRFRLQSGVRLPKLHPRKSTKSRVKLTIAQLVCDQWVWSGCDWIKIKYTYFLNKCQFQEVDEDLHHKWYKRMYNTLHKVHHDGKRRIEICRDSCLMWYIFVDDCITVRYKTRTGNWFFVLILHIIIVMNPKFESNCK